ncbi:2,3-bisphosphoglycerate-independent phosphoglycerate mutase [Thermoplasmatales archaeon]|nr:2,3-bisphosphoglycerate-independent phosphoglycerate mutase [Thermoplasmatales archaeon]
MKKIMLIIMDGLGDRPNPELGNMTALQAAFRPNLNFMARNGINGLMHPISPGIRAGSDTSHLSLLGYDPKEVYTGRGPFEAMGLGMEVKAGDIAFRANFATRDDSMRIVDRRAGRLTSGTADLARSLNIEINGVEFRVKEGVEHRAALVMHGSGLSPNVTDSDPHDPGKKVSSVSATKPDGDLTASLINKFLVESRKILDESDVNHDRIREGLLPANELLLRGAGIAPSLESFTEKFKMNGACVVGIPMISGICRLAGIKPISIPGVTGRVDTDYRGKIRGAIEALKEYDYVLVNIKATDIAGHDGDPMLKREVIEKADDALGQLIPLSDNAVICITGDHSTPCSMKDHSGDPVPIVFYSEGIIRDRVERFDEISAQDSALRLMSGDVMQYLMQLSERSEKYGA